MGGMTDLFGGSSMPQPTANFAGPNVTNIFEDSNLKIEFQFSRNNGNEHNIKAFFSSKMANLTQVSLQVAV